MMNKILMTLLTSLISHFSMAQVEMADNFRSEGKIYIVIAIILVIMAGFFYLLIKLDRKTKRLEKELKEK